MKKLFIGFTILLVIGVIGFLGYALVVKPKPKSKRPPVAAEAPSASADPVSPADAALAAGDATMPDAPAAESPGGNLPEIAPTGSEVAPAAVSVDGAGGDLADAAVGPADVATSAGVDLVPSAAPLTPPPSPPESPEAPSTTAQVAQAAEPAQAVPPPATPAKPRSPGASSLMATWKSSPRDAGRPLSALQPFSRTLAGAGKQTLIAHTDFIEQRPGVYTAMLLWNGPKPELNVINQRAGLVALDIPGARLAGELPSASINSFTSGVSGDSQRIVYGGYGAITLDVNPSKKSAIVTLMDTGSRQAGASRPRNAAYTAVVMGEAPPVRTDQVLADADCTPLSSLRLEQMARDGMPIDQCINVVYHRANWSVVAVSPSAAVIRRGGTTMTVAPGSIVPDLGKVTSLDSVGLQVLTEGGPILVN